MKGVEEKKNKTSGKKINQKRHSQTLVTICPTWEFIIVSWSAFIFRKAVLIPGLPRVDLSIAKKILTSTKGMF